MHGRRLTKFRPGLERLEAKRLLNTGPSTAPVAHLEADAKPSALHSVDTAELHGAMTDLSKQQTTQPSRFLAFRITVPSYPVIVNLVPPFHQLLVQNRQPVPGHIYNILQVVVNNGTKQTFTASSDLTVRLTSQTKAHDYPILTGNEQWKPKQWFVFYVLTNRYYPVSFIGGGFQLDLGGASSTLVPGPSGIFLRLKYDPSTFAKTLDWIVAYGQGAQLGKGPPVGMPDTAIYEIIAADANHIDFAGRF